MRCESLVAVFYMDGKAVGTTELKVSRITKRNIYVPFYNGAEKAYVIPKSKVYTDDDGRNCFDVDDNTECVYERKHNARRIKQ